MSGKHCPDCRQPMPDPHEGCPGLLDPRSEHWRAIAAGLADTLKVREATIADQAAEMAKAQDMSRNGYWGERAAVWKGRAETAEAELERLRLAQRYCELVLKYGGTGLGYNQAQAKEMDGAWNDWVAAMPVIPQTQST